MPLLSIIVPIYGVENYIHKCLESIRNQSFADLEAILIDDGSPDQSGRIADEYAAMDPRFIVIHQKNQGVSSARNAGLAVAQGKWIGFVDPDDWILPDMYEKMVLAAEKEQADIVCCNWLIANDAGTIQGEHMMPEMEYRMDKETIAFHLFDSPRSIGGCVWSKLLRRDKINLLFDPQIRLVEDKLFLMDFFRQSQMLTGIILDKSLYVYRESKGGITRRSDNRTQEAMRTEKQILDHSKEISKKVYKYAQKDYLDTCLRFIVLNESSKSASRKTILSIFRIYVWQHIFEIIANPFICWKTKIMYFLLSIGFLEIK